MAQHIVENRSLSASKLEERLVFFLVFLGVLALTYGFLFLVDFLPEKPTPDAESPGIEIVSVEDTTRTLPKENVGEGESTLSEQSERTQGGDVFENNSSSVRAEFGEAQDNAPSVTYEREEVSADPYPNRIIFDTLDGRSVPVLNPQSRSIEALDTALLSGVVRHPDSGDFDRTGTIVLFGHSSYLPKVINKNFQAFNGIQKLTWGDTVRLQSSDTEYVYRVDRVYEASANDAEVKVETGKPKLTLVTCDSFGSKTDRFIVEATLIESRSRS